MALVQKLIPTTQYPLKSPYQMVAKGLCIHNTANDASAQNERDYLAKESNKNEVSFHIAVDDKESIQCLPFNRNAWASGDGANGEGNRNYIHLEICYSLSGGEKFNQAERRTVQEVALLLKQYGWTTKNVKKHQDFANKYCPHRTLDYGWDRFIKMIEVELNKLNEVYDMKKIVVYYGDADVFGAIMLSQKLGCPLMKKASYDVSGLKAETVHQVGGRSEDTNRYVTFKNVAKLL